MKTLFIEGGSSNDPMILQNRDVLNTVWTLKNDVGIILFRSQHCCRIPSLELFGKNQIALHGILAPGNYQAIWTPNIPSIGDGAVLQGVLPSLKFNPSMGNFTVSQIVCHSTYGDYGNGSEACQVCYYKEFHEAFAGKDSFEAQLTAGETINLVITDTPEFTAQLQELIKQYPYAIS